MKKRIYGMVLGTAIIAAMTTGCGSKGSEEDGRANTLFGMGQNTGFVETQQAPGSWDEPQEQETDETQEADESSETAEIPEEPEVPKYELNISDWSYESAPNYISEKYSMVEVNGMFYLIDNDGNILPDEMFPEGLGNGFDYVKLYQQGGSFIVRKTTDEGYFISAILSMELEPLFIIGTENPSLYYVTDFRDNLVFVEQLEIKDDGSINPDRRIRACGLIINGRIEFSDTAFYTDMIRVFNVSDGFVICSMRSNQENIDAYSFVKPASIEYNMIFDDVPIDYSVDEGLFIPEVDGCPVIFVGSLQGNDGWIYAGVLNKEKIDDGDGKWHQDLMQLGFYNIYSCDFVALPDGNTSIKTFCTEDGNPYITSIDGKSIVVTERNEEGASIYRVFDINTGAYATEDEYLYLQAENAKLILAQNIDGKWGYLSGEDFTHIGEWYDDATVFCNGLAVVTNNGKAHLINESFEIVSVEFEAEVASACSMRYDFSDMGESAVFNIKKNNKYYVMKIEK